MTDDEIRINLLELIKKIKEIIDIEKTKGTIMPEFELFKKWQVTDFNYDDKGPQIRKNACDIKRPIWRSAFVNLVKIIEKNDNYQDVSNFLKCEQNIKDHNPNLGVFIQRIISLYLEKGDLSESEINKRIEAFVLELNNKPIRSGANVQLVGIILHPEEIEICNGVTLRRPKKEDFEVEIPAYGFGPDLNFNNPTAFLEISMERRSPLEIQEEVFKAVTILRLFKLGSVKYISYRMFSDSTLLLWGGTHYSGDRFSALENCIITDEDVDNLKKFWEILSPVLPPALYKFDSGKVDHISIAYNSYCDSLLQSGIEEKRIANAIMGLEALYFKSEERTELNQRLSLRTAKLLSLFFNDPIKIRRVVKDAYEVRSTYLHGSRLKDDEKERLLKHYNGNLNDLSKIVLNYLRKSLIIFITVDMSKDHIISLLEDSFISRMADDELKRRFESVEVNIN
jgi:hypothetical protein